jgi:hypothetical protein
MTHADELLIAALDLAGAGRPVFPCRPGAKAPLTRRGHLDATTDERKVRFWWTECWPGANIGVPTGNGVAVIDVDPGGELWADTVLDEGPLTLTVRTARGGLHLYYMVGVAVPNSASKLADHVDVRGDGGYVLVPPSATADGAYSYEEAVPPAPMPDWLLGECLRAKPVAQRHEGTGSFGPGFEPADRIAEGGRNDYIARFTGWALNADDEQTQEELLATVMLHNLDTCVPPLPEWEVRRTVQSIWRRHHA